MTDSFVAKNFIKSTYIFIVVLFLVKAVFSNIIYDTYTIDRILVTMYMSIFIAYTVITVKEPMVNNIFKNPFFYFGLYCIAQAFVSPYIKGNFEEHQQILIGSLIVLFIYFTNLSISSYFREKDFAALVLFSSALIALLLSLDSIYFTIASTKNYTMYQSIIKYFKNTRVLNHLQIFIIPILFIFFVTGKKNIKILASILTIFNGYLIAYTGARGLFITLLIVSAVFYGTVSNKTIKKNFHIFSTMIIAGMFLCFLQIIIMHNNIGNVYNFVNHTTSGRMEIYKTILPYIINIKYFLPAIGFSSQDIAVTHLLHPHNLFLYVFLGAGTLGMIYFLFIAVSTLVILGREYLSTQSWSTKIMYLNILSFFIYSMVSGVYITPLTYFYVALNILSIAEKNKVRFSSMHYIVAKFVSIVTILISLFFLLSAISDSQRYNEINRTSHKTTIYHIGVILSPDSIYN